MAIPRLRPLRGVPHVAPRLHNELGEAGLLGRDPLGHEMLVKPDLRSPLRTSGSGQ
jgi:hypothetical protein